VPRLSPFFFLEFPSFFLFPREPHQSTNYGGRRLPFFHPFPFPPTSRELKRNGRSGAGLLSFPLSLDLLPPCRVLVAKRVAAGASLFFFRGLSSPSASVGRRQPSPQRVGVSLSFPPFSFFSSVFLSPHATSTQAQIKLPETAVSFLPPSFFVFFFPPPSLVVVEEVGDERGVSGVGYLFSLFGSFFFPLPF